ncbi:NADP-dependent oxidoreductase domain-containing protein [Triangularia verruculosa]|uniref:NADP-dependent oxidoreductase domain-containing protein n=1 Tax=Triangularia verruculosa TaxID=2587418 RepID=A0AAN6X928_9PEZI|nr:NADP-dependent oxidoreductase domain-containing protein [Triangularia verruculosa]
MAPPSLPIRKLGRNGPEIPAIGLGLMGLSIAYGDPGDEASRLAFLDHAWSIGCTNWDTADAYGDCEDLLGKWFSLHPERRKDIFLASKFALAGRLTPEGEFKFGIDSTPEYAQQAIEKSLTRLGVEYLDLYYIHRTDGKTPIEKTVGALKELKEQGKIKAIGLSECSSNTLRRASKIVQIDAVQVEYNPWQLDIENETGTDLLATCRELSVTVFAYSPLGRGFLTGQIKSVHDFGADDFRRLVPRFNPENFSKNLEIVEKLGEIAKKKGCTTGQLALAWLMAQGPDIIPIPGTKKIKYLEENVASVNVHLSDEDVNEIRATIDSAEVLGDRVVPDFLDGLGPDQQLYQDTPEL